MSWLQTTTGRAFDLLDPRPEDVDIIDIAWSLGRQCRYLGHTHVAYSVAQHSVLVSEALPPELRLLGLMHDAAEAYVGDMPKPLKALLPEFSVIEDRIWRAIAERFDLPAVIPAEVKRVDTRILADEHLWLMGPSPRDWCPPEPALGIRIDPWGPDHAARVFQQRFDDLWLEF